MYVRKADRIKIKYLRKEKRYQLVIPNKVSNKKLIVIPDMEKIVAHKNYRSLEFRERKDVPEKILATWVITNKVLTDARKTNKVMCLKTKAEVYKKENERMVVNLGYYAKHKAKYEFEVLYKKWSYWHGLNYNVENSDLAYKRFQRYNESRSNVNGN